LLWGHQKYVSDSGSNDADSDSSTNIALPHHALLSEQTDKMEKKIA